jgi:hypothetical protein
VHIPNTPRIKEVYWYPPKAYSIKCNIDGAALGCPKLAACGGIFIDGEIIGVPYAFNAEIIGVMMTIEIANIEYWPLLWLRGILLWLL